ncbi:hypothetical protein KCMC57_64820 (plasmid) [Kitasatospora sp. CMC57]|uniref:Uncharacterized protein n=1 Tax=Kitasatospora sp. CMC57 TaxID=3231513 RepID=A0AB33K8X3_9ACTN
MTHHLTDPIRALLTAGLTNTAISAKLHIDRATVARLRREAGVPDVPRRPSTLEESWRQRTRPTDGGHMEWTGATVSGGHPVMRYAGTTYSATRVAYRIQHGQDPAGYAKPNCGRRHCVAPAHQTDTGQTRTAHQHRVRYASPEAKLAALTEPTADGHLRWTGPTDGDHPLLKHAGRRWPVLSLAFEQTHGRKPSGSVSVDCTHPHCLLGEHLSDKASRVQLRPASEPKPQPAQYASVQAKFEAFVVPTGTGHLDWSGPVNSAGRAIVPFAGRIRTAARIAFEVRYGREPVGYVSVACDHPHCLAGDHLDDAVSRRAHRAAFAALGL